VNPSPDAFLLEERRKAISLLDLDGVEMPNRLHVTGDRRLDHVVREKLVIEGRDGATGDVPSI
jgi:hypothetical protein